MDMDGRHIDVVAPFICNGKSAVHKVASTSHDRSASWASAWLGNHLDLLTHRTTVATDVLLRRNRVPTGLITTAGFCDILQIVGTGGRSIARSVSRCRGSTRRSAARRHRKGAG